MRSPIADCRLPIVELPARRGFPRRGHDGGQVNCFLQKRRRCARE